MRKLASCMRLVASEATIYKSLGNNKINCQSLAIVKNIVGWKCRNATGSTVTDKAIVFHCFVLCVFYYYVNYVQRQVRY